MCFQVVTTLLSGRMFGEGDMMRHLFQLTYKLLYNQDPLDESNCAQEKRSIL